MTQTERVLELLRRQGSNGLTAYEAQQEGCGSRLAARIGELKAARHVIESDFVTVRTLGGGTARVKRYRLLSRATVTSAPTRGEQEPMFR